MVNSLEDITVRMGCGPTRPAVIFYEEFLISRHFKGADFTSLRVTSQKYTQGYVFVRRLSRNSISFTFIFSENRRSFSNLILQESPSDTGLAQSQPAQGSNTAMLNIFNLNARIQNNRLNWIHHVERMEPERIPAQIMDYAPRGTRCLGRLKLH
jgi:hypothetical protein